MKRTSQSKNTVKTKQSKHSRTRHGGARKSKNTTKHHKKNNKKRHSKQKGAGCGCGSSASSTPITGNGSIYGSSVYWTKGLARPF